MKNWLLVLLFIVSCNPSNSKKVVIERHLDNSPKLVAYYENNIKVKEIEYYNGGYKRLENSFNDSLKHGKYFLWYKDGTLWAEGNYKMGKKDGHSFEYGPDGIKKKDMFYKNGKNIIYSKFYSNGIKSIEINGEEDKVYAWYENGQLDAEIPNVFGKCKYYYENGSKKNFGYIKNGAKDSLWHYWDVQGNLIKELIYKNGVLMDSVVYKNNYPHAGTSL